jgi:hypothetical protein
LKNLTIIFKTLFILFIFQTMFDNFYATRFQNSLFLKNALYDFLLTYENSNTLSVIQFPHFILSNISFWVLFIFTWGNVKVRSNNIISKKIPYHENFFLLKRI